MKRYIDADKLKEKLKELRSPAYSDFDSGMLLGNEKAQAALEMMPTADVVELKHEKWIFSGNEKKCSGCKFIYYSNKDEWNYCPNCGAKMDVSKKEISTEGDTSDA